MVMTFKEDKTNEAISVLLGFFDFVPINDTKEKELAEFLTAEVVQTT
jgi:hypothetical protein